MERMKPAKMPKHDYSALRSRINVQYGNECRFAQEIGLNKSQLSNRFTGKSPMHPCEIYRICDVLEIPYMDMLEENFMSIAAKVFRDGQKIENPEWGSTEHLKSLDRDELEKLKAQIEDMLSGSQTA